MKHKIKAAIMDLQESTDPNATIRFSHTRKDKSFKAAVAYSETGEPVISLVSHKGYNKDYLKRKFRAHAFDLQNLTTFEINEGDIILTRQYLQDPPSAGTVVTLPGSTYYYSVNAGLMSCNGDQLGTDHQARFIKLLTAKCNPDSAIMQYSQFKLL